ncbi:MAG: response regulator transcription factor [Eubacterium sp.]|nr:response regulator transcription factor [Eubacterium sp.]
MPLIYILEDDDSVRELEAYALRGNGYEVGGFSNPKDFYEALEREKPDLVVADVMLPGEDGLSVTKKLRASSEYKNIPIVIVSAKDSEIDAIRGFDNGADDYITKPFNPSELMARVKSQLRRFMVLGAMDKKPDVIRNGGMELDTKAKTVYVDGEEIKLTKLEYKIVELLMKNIGTVFSNDEIYRLVWNEESFITDNTIAVHIRHIREKIEINPKEPKYLQVVWGVGYKIVANK